jgi:hypothetical protein
LKEGNKMAEKKDEKFELLKHINQDAEMASYTIENLLNELKEKDNKIKEIAEDILKQYQHFLKETKEVLNKNKISSDEKGFIDKIGAKMGIKMNVTNDNSDSSIADMLIKGISMGSIDMEKKINDYKKSADEKSLSIAKDFLKFQTDSINKLKNYL